MGRLKENTFLSQAFKIFIKCSEFIYSKGKCGFISYKISKPTLLWYITENTFVILPPN